MSDCDGKDEALTGIDAGKRATLMRLVAGTALMAAPVVASYAMDELTLSEAHAMAGNGAALRRSKSV